VTEIVLGMAQSVPYIDEDAKLKFPPQNSKLEEDDSSERNLPRSVEMASENVYLQVPHKKSSHIRSRSDGHTLQLQQASHLFEFKTNSNSDNEVSRKDDSTEEDPNLSPSKRKRKTSAPQTFTEFDNLNHLSNIMQLQEQENQSLPSLACLGSRFPRPKPGESLVSFLSSADLYKNCGALDRENAHFYISEALMAAFEQVIVHIEFYILI